VHHAGAEPAEHRAAVAHIAASTAYLRAAGENIQVHGGIGITWEHDAHLHLKRAQGSATLFGSPAQYRDRLAELVVAPTTP
jgi:alkylation response protein AidB-like acyl-CoA dehydrogenase